jgi:hypothetical protein
MASFAMSSIAAPALSSKYSISRSKAALKSTSRHQILPTIARWQ